MEINKPYVKILKVLLKDITIKPTITSLAKEIDMSRVGIWKVLKKMQFENLIILSPVGAGKTSIYRIGLNWGNPIVEKMISLSLIYDAQKNQRWINEFSELEGKTDFLIIYGSILHSPKEANDIDLLGVVSDKKHFKEIEQIVNKIQKTQVKKIHILNFTQQELKDEIEGSNKALIDAIKKGIILFGQEKFIKFMKDLSIK